MMDLTTPTSAYQLLSPQEREAVDQYVNMVEVDAAQRGERVAIYADKPIPSELVRRSRGIFDRPLVLAAVTEQLHKVADKQDVSPRRVIAENAALAFSNMADFIKIGAFGELEVDLTKVTREQMRAVKTIRIVDNPSGRKVEITLYDKQQALAQLREIMEMPTLTDYNQSTSERKIADDAAQAYTNLLESMRS